ncbi:hypothetical protein [Campylobacter cuniculorum]|uniref:hypothetical protein n=1 Tax=Campylobacter cuniculorum TaxID=374106 RepID=UPI0023F08EC7|nr:hypothetical protein [Campylobacter cuniculorum]
MITTTCIAELTKKTKIKGLTPKSWFIIIIAGFISWFILFFYSLAVVVILYAIFSILEFLDEDIYEIIGSKFKISANKFYA